jgi:hypothetical protein
MRKFTCDQCGGTFESTWSEAEAVAECETTFGITPTSETCAHVCDDCYEFFLASMRLLKATSDEGNPN